MSTTTLTGRENLAKYAFWLGPVGPSDEENQVKMYKKYGTFLGTVHYLFETVRFWIRIKQPDPCQIKKQDPDRYQSDEQDPDPYQKGLDPQHCI
jgi:hypothetical protein